MNAQSCPVWPLAIPPTLLEYCHSIERVLFHSMKGRSGQTHTWRDVLGGENLQSPLHTLVSRWPQESPLQACVWADTHTCPIQVCTPGFIELCLPSEAHVWPTGHRHTEVSTGVSLLCISQRGKQQSEHLQNHYREKNVKSE